MKINILTKRLPIIVILIMSAFFGCVGPFDNNHAGNSSDHSHHSPVNSSSDTSDTYKSGMVRLFFNEQNARTILPTFTSTENQFKFFNVIFIAKDDPTGGKTAYFPIKGSLGNVEKDYLVAEGRYEKVIVEAFYSEECNKEYLGAIGESGEFEVTSSGKDVNVFMDIFNSDELKPEGVFKWNIINTLNNPIIGAGDTAVMIITPKTCGVYSYEINLINAKVTTTEKDKGVIKTESLTNSFNNQCSMENGIYDVSFEFGRSGFSSVKFSEILYIVRGGTTSSYTYTIPKLASLTAVVTYSLNKSYTENKTVSVSVGSLITSSPSLLFTREEYFDPTEEILGWYKDSACTKEWNFSFDRVLSDMTLYAKWSESATDIPFYVPIGNDKPSVKFVFKEIPAATNVTLGSPTGEPGRQGNETQHQVTLSGFYMGKFEVTQEQYSAVMGTNPSGFSSNPLTGESQVKRPVDNMSWYGIIVFCNTLSIKASLTPVYSIGGKTNPAEWGAVPGNSGDNTSNTTWDAVTMNTNANGYRMPTEAEWEYACRAGTVTAYNNGTTANERTGWYNANSGNITHEVGRKPANKWGLYDMHGNVAEWVWDRINNYPATSTNPVGPTVPGETGKDIRVNRGGNFYGGPSGIRSAMRDYTTPAYRETFVGIRLARSL
jgi:uncharacterized repeat protein (TIGR02543 family)